MSLLAGTQAGSRGGFACQVDRSRPVEKQESDLAAKVVREDDKGIYISGARTVSTLPIVFPLHAALHLASMVGDRCCVLAPTDAQSMIVRRNAAAYGFGSKLTSVRHVSRSSTWSRATPSMRSSGA